MSIIGYLPDDTPADGVSNDHTTMINSGMGSSGKISRAGSARVATS